MYLHLYFILFYCSLPFISFPNFLIPVFSFLNLASYIHSFLVYRILFHVYSLFIFFTFLVMYVFCTFHSRPCKSCSSPFTLGPRLCLSSLNDWPSYLDWLPVVPWWWWQPNLMKCWYLSTKLHGVTAETVLIFTFFFFKFYILVTVNHGM